MNRCYPFILAIMLSVAPLQTAGAQTFPRGMTSFVYFTGIGCPHCAKTDPVLFKQKVRQHDLLVIEYEIYWDGVNAPLLLNYDSQLGTGFGIPMIVAGRKKDNTIVGDWPILQNLTGMIARHKGNQVTLPTRSVPFEKLVLTDLPGKPKIWFKNRVACRRVLASRESDAIKAFLLTGRVPQGCTTVRDREVALSDDKVVFREACLFDGWVLMRD